MELNKKNRRPIKACRLDHFKEKGEQQDFFIFTDAESAQVFYDVQGKVTAIAANYVGDESGAHKPVSVLGEEIEARPEGSLYELTRYLVLDTGSPTAARLDRATVGANRQRAGFIET